MAHWWNNYPWRVIQPNFREIDTLDFDEERFLVELEEFSCNMVMLNAAGLIAGYDTELEDHTRSAYIDNFDLRHLVDRCHENGIQLVFSHVNEQPMNTMKKDGFVEKVGEDNFRPHIDDAIEWAKGLI